MCNFRELLIYSQEIKIVVSFKVIGNKQKNNKNSENNNRGDVQPNWVHI